MHHTTDTKTLRPHRYYRDFTPQCLVEMELAVARLTGEQEASEKLLKSVWWDSHDMPPMPREVVHSPVQFRLVEAKRRLKLARYGLDPDQGTTIISMKEQPERFGVLIIYHFWDALSAVDDLERFDAAFYAEGEHLEVYRAVRQVKAGEADHEEDDPYGRDEAFRHEYAKHRQAFPMVDEVATPSPVTSEKRNYQMEFWGIRKAIHGPRPKSGAEKAKLTPVAPEAVHEALERVTKAAA